MADVLTLVFRTFLSNTSQKKVGAGVPAPGPRSCLLVGQHRISRPLLLLAAVTAASETGVRVTFFTPTQIQSLPVFLQKSGPSLSPESLKRITFSYPRSLEELLQQVAGLHESPTPPSLIIVDRLEDFLSGSACSGHVGLHSAERLSAAHLSALLCDTSAFLTRVLQQKGSSSFPCCLIASFLSKEDSQLDSRDSSTSDPILDVVDRYFQVRCTLDQDRSYEAAAASAQEVWHIYLSGGEVLACDDGSPVGQEWKVFVYADGVMEFSLVGP
uniref:SWIM-type zinc finger 7 associated protein 1 n=2 Tax=Nothobranchius korthausae TaxID=1143690 RepID=A0A1A8FB46_9TELE